MANFFRRESTRLSGTMERMEGAVEGLHCYDWFFCTKQLSKEDVESKLGKQ